MLYTRQVNSLKLRISNYIPAAGELTEVRFDRPVWAGGEANTDSHSIDRSLYDDQEPAQPDLPVEVRSDEPELAEDPDFDRRWQEALAFAKERKWKEGSPNADNTTAAPSLNETATVNAAVPAVKHEERYYYHSSL
jgi:hypothetical protein